jgi:hypothetical protein
MLQDCIFLGHCMYFQCLNVIRDSRHNFTESSRIAQYIFNYRCTLLLSVSVVLPGLKSRGVLQLALFEESEAVVASSGNVAISVIIKYEYNEHNSRPAETWKPTWPLSPKRRTGNRGVPLIRACVLLERKLHRQKVVLVHIRD